MSPIELFEEGRLTEALAAQVALVNVKPEEIAERLLLCDFLAFSGDRVAVGKHLQSLSSGPAEIQEYLVEWRQLLKADDARHSGQMAGFLLDPPLHIVRRFQALKALFTDDRRTRSI